MKKLNMFIAIFFIAGHAFAQMDLPPSGGNPRATISEEVGITSITIKYSRPDVNKREGDWYMTGFSPKKQNISIYIIPGFGGYTELMKKLGKYKISAGSCLYINKLADVDEKILTELVSLAYKHMKEKYKK